MRLETNKRVSGVREYSVTHSLTLYSRLFLTHSYSFTVPSPVSLTLSHLISFSLPLTQLFEDLDKRIRGEVVKKWERGRVLHYLLISPLSPALFLSQRQQQTKTLYYYNSKRVNIKVQNKLSSSEYVQCFLLTMDYFLTPLWII